MIMNYMLILTIPNIINNFKTTIFKILLYIFPKPYSIIVSKAWCIILKNENTVNKHAYPKRQFPVKLVNPRSVVTKGTRAFV